MNFESKLESFDSWGCYVNVPVTIAEKFIKGKDRRIICSINNKVSFHCALLPSHGNYLITVNKDHRRKLGVQPGSNASSVY